MKTSSIFNLISWLLLPLCGYFLIKAEFNGIMATLIMAVNVGIARLEKDYKFKEKGKK